MKLSSTAVSTAEDDAAVAACLPPDVAARTFDRLNELERRRASDYDSGQRVRDIRTAKKEAAIQLAIEDHRHNLLRCQPDERLTYLMAMIDLRPKRYGLKQKPDGEYRHFDPTTVRRVLEASGF